MSCLHIVTIGYLLLLPLTNINGKEQYDKNFIAGMDKFAVQLYSALADKYPDKYILFSPLSIQMCATMATMGARGETATELRRGLGFGSLDNDVLANMYNGFLTKYENSNIMKISNKIYVADGWKCNETFIDAVKSKFHSEVSNLDFMDAEEAVISINDWVESKTNHLIKNFIPFGAFQRRARIILLNVIHFKAKWDSQPYEQDSIVINEKYVCDRYKFLSNHYWGHPYGETNMVSFPDSNILDLGVHPKVRGDTRQLDNYIKTISINGIIKQTNEIRSGWSIESCNADVDTDLVDAFQKLGMNRIFDNKGADFRDMMNVTENLKISRIIHRTNISINNEGPEAVAATAIQFHARCSGKYNDNQNALCGIRYMYTYVHKTEDGDFIPIFMGRGV